MSENDKTDSPSIAPEPRPPIRLIKRAEAEAMMKEIVNGDQSWRATIKERYAEYIEGRAAAHADVIAKSEKMLIGCNDADLETRFRATIASLDSVRLENLRRARDIRAGLLTFDAVEAELILRAL